jgi:multimeric flavodoxin WrbA
MKNIVCLLGSPRLDGNSATIAKRFLSAAEARGATPKTYALNTLSYRGCQGCYVCKHRLDRCVLEDDLTEVLDAVKNADMLVLASPVYYGDISSQLKGFIDRSFSYLVPDYITNPNPCRLAPGKKLVFILTQGQPDEEKFADVFPRYDAFLSWYGFTGHHLIRACGVSKQGDAELREVAMKMAEETATLLVPGPERQ